MNMKEKINVKKHLKDIASNLSEIKTGIRDSDLTSEDVSELKDGLMKAELMAYKIKLDIALDKLYSEEPNLLSRDVLMKTFPILRPDISKSLLPILTNFILDEWEVRRKKMAA